MCRKIVSLRQEWPLNIHSAGLQPWIYLVCVDSSSLSPEEIRAAAEIHRELGPDYQDAVVESFLDRMGKQIDARVDSRVAAAQQQAAQPVGQSQQMKLAIVSMAFGIPLSGIALGVSANQLAALAVVWIAIAVINLAYALSVSRRSRGR